MLHTHLSSAAGTTGQLVAEVPSGLSLTPFQEIQKKVQQFQENHDIVEQSACQVKDSGSRKCPRRLQPKI
jgi:hypothetical protein